MSHDLNCSKNCYAFLNIIKTKMKVDDYLDNGYRKKNEVLSNRSHCFIVFSNTEMLINICDCPCESTTLTVTI